MSRAFLYPTGCNKPAGIGAVKRNENQFLNYTAMKNEKENKNPAKNQQQTDMDKKKPGKAKDIGNNLDQDAVGKMGSNNPTPQARTDNEQKDKR